MRLLRRGVSNCQATLLLLRSVVVDSLLGDVADQGSAVDEGGGVEHTVLEALLDDLPDSCLR